MNDYFDMLLTAIGIGICSGVLGYLLVSVLASRVKLLRLKFVKQNIPYAVRMLNPTTKEADMPEWLRRWMAKSEKKLKKAEVKVSSLRFIVWTVLGAVVGFGIGLLILKNLPAAIIAAISAFLIPEQILVGKIQAGQAKMLENLGVAVRMFSAEFADTPQVDRALSRVAAQIHGRLGEVLQKASRELAVAKDPDEVLSKLMEDLDFEYGRMFVQLLRVAWEQGKVARPLFSRLSSRVSGMQTLVYKNRAGLAHTRLTAIAVNALILPVFLAERHFIPEAGPFMVDNPIGRIIVTLCLLSVLFGVVIDRFMNAVDV